MAVKKGSAKIYTVTANGTTFTGTLKEINKRTKSEVKEAKRESKVKPSKVKTELPSSIKTKEGKFTVTTTRTGKIKITNPQGKTVTVPRGTNVTAMAYRGGGGGLGGLFGIKNR